MVGETGEGARWHWICRTALSPESRDPSFKLDQAGGDWERGNYLQDEVEKGLFHLSFEKGVCFVALIWPSPSCGFLLLKGSLAGTHNCTWVSWGSCTHHLKLDQEPVPPHFSSSSWGPVRSQISSITTQLWKCEPAFLLTSNRWRNVQGRGKGCELRHPVCLAPSLPAAVISNQGTHFLDYGLVNSLFGIY